VQAQLLLQVEFARFQSIEPDPVMINNSKSDPVPVVQQDGYRAPRIDTANPTNWRGDTPTNLIGFKVASQQNRVMLGPRIVIR
jgi:hypothetical protein